MSRPEIYEKDVDELLERRLTGDSKFVEQFVSRISEQLPNPVSFKRIGVDRQVAHEGASGTIDLLIRLFDEKKENARLLVENKLDSSFTPTQPQRYGSTSLAMSKRGRPAYAVICAPRDYLLASKYLDPFHARIAYEEFADWIDGEDRELADLAILRFSMPYEPEAVPEVAEFHAGYEALAKTIAPELSVKKNPNPKGERPEASRTIYFKVRECLPSYDFLPTLRFSHQCWDSSALSPSVKIMFDGWAVHEQKLKAVASDALGNTNFYLRKAGRSLGLVADTPRMDNKRAVSQQYESVSKGVRAAAALRAWMFANESILREWASTVK